MLTAERFRHAVEAGDHDALRALLAEDIQIFGPVVAEPVRGIKDAGAVLWAALSRLDNIHYVRVETHMLLFRAELAGNVINGVDILELDGEGLITTLTVLFRPLEWVAGTGFTGRRWRWRPVVSRR